MCPRHAALSSEYQSIFFRKATEMKLSSPKHTICVAFHTVSNRLLQRLSIIMIDSKDTVNGYGTLTCSLVLGSVGSLFQDSDDVSFVTSAWIAPGSIPIDH